MLQKIDCTINEDLQKAFGIRGFPTIKFLKSGQVYDYSGQRTVKDFVSFVEDGWKDLTPQNKPPRPKIPAATSTEVPPAASHEEKGENKESDVIVLDSNNFYDSVSQGEWLVEFYAPWCGFCKRLAPVWEQLATQLKEIKATVKIAKVDADTASNRALSRQFEIKGFPTIKYFRDGQVRDYEGDRSLESFKTFTESGWKAVPHYALPMQFYFFNKALDSLIEAVEPALLPYDAVILEHVGKIIIGMTFFGPFCRVLYR